MIGHPADLKHSHDTVNQAAFHLAQAHRNIASMAEYVNGELLLRETLDPKTDPRVVELHREAAGGYNQAVAGIAGAMGFISKAVQAEKLLRVHEAKMQQTISETSRVVDLQDDLSEWRYKAQYLERELALLRRPWWVKLRDWVYSRGLNPKTGIHPDYEPED